MVSDRMAIMQLVSYIGFQHKNTTHEFHMVTAETLIYAVSTFIFVYFSLNQQRHQLRILVSH